jgi:hypothetical protein
LTLDFRWVFMGSVYRDKVVRCLCAFRAPVLLDIDDNSSQDVLNFLRASIIDSSKFSTKEDAMRHTTYVALYKYG